MTRNLITAALISLGVVSAFGAPPGFDHHAIWKGEDDLGSVTLDLRSDGECTIIFDVRAGDSVKRFPCTYWIHGGRVRLRAHGERAGEGLNLLEIEHLRGSDTLVILGERRQVLTRQHPNL